MAPRGSGGRESGSFAGGVCRALSGVSPAPWDKRLASRARLVAVHCKIMLLAAQDSGGGRGNQVAPKAWVLNKSGSALRAQHDLSRNKSLHGMELALRTPFSLQWIPCCPWDRVQAMPRLSVGDTPICLIPWGSVRCIPQRLGMLPGDNCQTSSSDQRSE